LLALGLSACPFDVIRVDQSPAQLDVATTPRPAIELTRDSEVDVGFGYKRILRKGTRWTWVGRLTTGDVYRTRDQVLTVEASNMHEAYIVVGTGQVVGFYLPVERTFVPISGAPVAIGFVAIQ
jgi:hypothetical protein